MAKKVIINGESGLIVRNKLNENFTELYDKDASQDTAIGNKSDVNHTHSEYEPSDPAIQNHLLNPHDYEPANANIQAHVSQPHAPANANYYEHPATHPNSMIDGLGSAATKNAGSGPFEVVQVGADGKLPAIDGSNLLNVAALTTDQQAAVDGANSPSGTNVFATIADVGSGSGDMPQATYDPDIIEGDAFDMDNMKDGIAKVAMTTQERTDVADNKLKVGITTEQAIIINDADTHHTDTSNPHSVTQAQVGLDQVTNTSDADKPVSTLQQNALNLKSNTDHTHTGVYEPSDPAIQTHITSTHAPADAQKNSDITKEEIELKLIGDDISSHRHEHRTVLDTGIGTAPSYYARRDQTLDEATTGNNWGEDGVILSNITTNRAAQIKATIDSERNVPRLLVRTSGLGPEESIQDSFVATNDNLDAPNSIKWATLGSWANCGLTTSGLKIYTSAEPDAGMYSKFFWTEDMDIDVQFKMRITDLTNNNINGYIGLIWDTEELTNTPYSDTTDYGASIHQYSNDYSVFIAISSSTNSNLTIYNTFTTVDTWIWFRFKRTVTAEKTFTFEILSSTDGIVWVSRNIHSNVTWMGDGAISTKMFFKFQFYYYSSSTRTYSYYQDFIDNLGNATYSEDTAWTEWGGTPDKLLNYNVSNITASATPASYPLGLSSINFDDKSLGFPAWRGTLITQKHSDDRANQILLSSGDQKIYTRSYETHLQSNPELYLGADFSTITNLDPYLWNLSYTEWGVKSFIKNGWLHLARQKEFSYGSSSYRNEIGIDYIPGFGQDWSIETQFDLNQIDWNPISPISEAIFVLGLSRDTLIFEESGSVYYRATFKLDMTTDALEFHTDNTLRGSVANFSTKRAGFLKIYRSGSTLYGQYKENEEDAWTTVGSGAETYADNGVRFWFGFVGTYQYAKDISRSIIKYKYFTLTNADTDGETTAATWRDWKESLTVYTDDASNGDTLVYDGYEFKPKTQGVVESKVGLLDQNGTITVCHDSDPNLERDVSLYEVVSGSAAQSFTRPDFSASGDYETKNLFYQDTSSIQFAGGAVSLTTVASGWNPYTIAEKETFSFSAYNTGAIYGLYLDDTGTKLFAAHNIATIGEWTLGTPFELTTATFEGEFTLPVPSNGINAIFFKPDGTRVYCIRSNSINLDCYDLTTAWTLADGITYSHSSSIDVVWESHSYDTKFCIDASGMHLYVSSKYTEMRYYQFGTAWDLTTLTYINKLDEDDPLHELPYYKYGIGITPDGQYLYGANSYENAYPYDGMYRWKLNTPFDMSSVESDHSYEMFRWEDLLPSNPYSTTGVFTPNGKYFLTSNTAGEGKLYTLFRSTTYDSTVPAVVTTSDLTSFSTVNVETINSISITKTTPTNTNIKCLVSFDGRKTWNMLRDNTWWPVIEIERFIEESGNDISDIETYFTAHTITDEQTIDFAFGLITTDGLETPTISQITINYDESDAYKIANLDDYDVFLSSSSTLIKKTSVGTSSIKAVVKVK